VIALLDSADWLAFSAAGIVFQAVCSLALPRGRVYAQATSYGDGIIDMHAIWIFFLLALGASVGSFLNVVVWRLPRNESIVFPASHCPSCGRAIRWYDNIPILSWLILRGRCRYCNVRISPRYLLVEAFTAVLIAGLYVAYYVFPVRDGLGGFAESWPVFAAHAILLCGLLACSLIDIESWQVPLEICWGVSVLGVLAATIWPSTNALPGVSPAAGAACIGAAVGLGISILLLRRGWLLPSFIDADYPPLEDEPSEDPSAPRVAITRECGVNPRREVLREVVFLLPAISLSIVAGMLVGYVPGIASAWSRLHGLAGGAVGEHMGGFYAAGLGYFVGGGLVWGMRIFGTLLFGKEAMGLGDVHLLAAAGAVCGWIIPVAAFFLAPFFGLLWAIYLFTRKGQRELPYGPWLSLGVLAAMLLRDPIVYYFRHSLQGLEG
jgi:leader peptidase (prepilin peptidase)/N-methyltransferase